MSEEPKGQLVWTLLSAESESVDVYSTLERAMFAAQDNLLSPERLSEPNDPETVYGWEPCDWTPVPIDGCPNISMVKWELRRRGDGEVLGTIRAQRIDEYLPPHAIYD